MYIVIRNWRKFQHYRDRTPKWIKNETELLHNEAYLNLSGHQRAVLHGLWLEYASSRCQLPLNTASITARLGLRVSSRQLDALNHAGFIEYTLAPRYQDASLEVEVDRDKKPLKEERGNGELRKTDSEHVLRTLIANGAIHDTVDLDAELRSGDHQLDDETIEKLRALLPRAETAASKVDDDIPF